MDKHHNTILEQARTIKDTTEYNKDKNDELQTKIDDKIDGILEQLKKIESKDADNDGEKNSDEDAESGEKNSDEDAESGEKNSDKDAESVENKSDKDAESVEETDDDDGDDDDGGMDSNTYPVESLDDALMQLMNRMISGSGIVFSKFIGQGLLMTIAMLTGEYDKVNEILEGKEVTHEDLKLTTGGLKHKLKSASEIVGAMATNRHIQSLLNELTEKITLFLYKIKIPATQISSIVVKGLVQVISENSTLMGKGVAKTMFGVLNTAISQIPIVGIIWSMLVFINTTIIYFIKFMNTITSTGAKTAINAAGAMKQKGGGGAGGCLKKTQKNKPPRINRIKRVNVTSKTSFDKVNMNEIINKYLNFKKEIKRTIQTCQ